MDWKKKIKKKQKQSAFFLCCKTWNTPLSLPLLLPPPQQSPSSRPTPPQTPTTCCCLSFFFQQRNLFCADSCGLDNNNNTISINSSSTVTIVIIVICTLNCFNVCAELDTPNNFFNNFMSHFTYIPIVSSDTTVCRGSARSLFTVVRWCQLSAPDAVTTSSPGNTLRVVFSSDWSVTYQGFSASYIVYDPHSGNSNRLNRY